MKRIGIYELGEILGEGGMGTVYRGRDPRFDRPVAIKVLFPQLARQADVASRFRSEAVIQAKLAHPSIVTVYDFVVEGEVLAFVMELVEGRTLEEILSNRSAQQPLEWTVEVMSQVLDAMAFAHGKGLIHRDLKPSNIIVSEHGRKPFAQVMDFGIAKILGSEKHKTATAAKMGTLAYMSPEHVRSPKHVDVRSDIYSLGAVLFELLEGKVPFGGDTEFEVMSQIVSSQPPPLSVRAVPSDFDRMIRTAMAKDPAQRFADCLSFQAALAAAISKRNSGSLQPDQQARDSSRVPSLEPPKVVRDRVNDSVGNSATVKKSQPLVLVLVAVVAVSLGLIGWLVMSRVQESRLISIEVHSNVSGDVVSIDGESLGSSPYLGELKVGRYLVEVTKTGCETYRQWVQVEADVGLQVTASLSCPELEVRSRLEAALETRDETEVRSAVAELERILGSRAAGDADVKRVKSWLEEKDGQRLAEAERARERAAKQEAERRAEETRKRAARVPAGAAVDPSTKLMWTKQDNGSDIDWHEAKRYCSDLALGGFRDWRMATTEDLKGIYDDSESDDCTTKWKRNQGGTYTCHSKHDIDLTAPWIWSSTKKDLSSAFGLNFFSGNRYVNSLEKESNARVLCVRLSGD